MKSAVLRPATTVSAPADDDDVAELALGPREVPRIARKESIDEITDTDVKDYLAYKATAMSVDEDDDDEDATVSSSASTSDAPKREFDADGMLTPTATPKRTRVVPNDTPLAAYLPRPSTSF